MDIIFNVDCSYLRYFHLAGWGFVIELRFECKLWFSQKLKGYIKTKELVMRRAQIVFNRVNRESLSHSGETVPRAQIYRRGHTKAV